jgi:hypothetical protein
MVTRRGFGSEAWRRRADNPTFEELTRVQACQGGSRVGRSICLCPREARSPGNGPPRPALSRARPDERLPFGVARIPRSNPEVRVRGLRVRGPGRDRTQVPDSATPRPWQLASDRSRLTRRATRPRPTDPESEPRHPAEPSRSNPAILPLPLAPESLPITSASLPLCLAQIGSSSPGSQFALRSALTRRPCRRPAPVA